jgi:outer membrane protein TolC
MLAALIAGIAATTLPVLPAAALTADDCVAIALKHNAEVKAAAADVQTTRAQAAQVEALVSPKISATSYVAPIFKAEGGLGTAAAYERDLSTWGPYAHVDAQVIFPLSTFGRHKAGVEAAEGRHKMEEAKARGVRHAVRREVRRLYGLRLYALSMRPNLNTGKEILDTAITKADELFAQQTGEVTVADRMKLRYGAAEISRFLRMADDGSALAALALKQVMGLPLDTEVRWAEDQLTLPAGTVPPLAKLVAAARRDRPEVAQLARGQAATRAWRQAEDKASLPVLFAALIGQADWSPARPRGVGASVRNQYNDYFAGVAAGLKWDLDLALSRAKTQEASAKEAWIDAQAERAATGIPLQVRKAYQEVMQHRDLAAIAGEQIQHTRKWMTFSAAAYETGTGEAKEVLEGVGAYLLAKKAYYDHLLGLWQAAADLELAVGTH